MNQDRVIGNARNLGGQVEQGLGRAVADAKTQADGVLDQAAGVAQNLYGQAKDTAVDAAEAIRSNASDAGDYVRKVIEERPFTVAIGALIFGWLIARMGRERQGW